MKHWSLDMRKAEALATKVDDVERRMAHIAGKSESNVLLHRGTQKVYVDPDLKLGMSVEDSVFKRHGGLAQSPNRYSIGGARGDAGLYASTAKETAMAELKGQAETATFATKTYNFKNVLDLTDPAITSKLGVSVEELTKTLAVDSAAYDLPQAIGFAAKRGGYDAIKFPSAQVRGGLNFVILN